MRYVLRVCCSFVVLLVPVWTQAAGPGLGNLTYSPSELWQPISVLDSPQGHGNVAMVNGYLMVVYASDGSVDAHAGGIEFWDVSHPRRPALVVRHANNDTHGLREAHGFSLSTDATRTMLAAQAHEGIQFWNLSDPLRIALLRYMHLPGISRGDYTGAWWVFWQAPYAYVAGTGSGLYIINATDPSNPTLVRQIPTGQLGGLRPAQVFALGNLLVLMEAASGTYATMDISDPTRPVLIQLFYGKHGYSHLFAAGKIFTAGGNGALPRLYVHSVTPQGQMAFVGAVGSGLDNGGYSSYQDGMVHAGFSNKAAKFNVATLQQLGAGSSGIASRDEDFSLVLGNLVFVGDDHGVGSALIVHQTAPDTRAPEVHWIHPPHGATTLPLTTRVGVSMSDNIDVASVNATTFIVRPLGGQALPGSYSVQMGLVNFTPAVVLQPDTTYEVVINGLRDYVGNRTPTFTSRFTTVSSTPALPPSGVISQVRATSGRVYQVGTLRAGARIYIDRTYDVTGQFPAAFANQQYIQTANHDKSALGSEALTFHVSTSAAVYVLYDARATRLPAWLNDGSWLRTGETVGTTDSGSSRIVYKKIFPPGTVALGGNAAAPALGAGSMYSVLVIGTGSSGGTPPACTLEPHAPAEVDAPVAFTAHTSTGSAPLSYTWDFGDGSTPTAPSSNTTAQHAYGAPGRYSVTLMVRNAVGHSRCATVQIIHNPLTAAPAVSASPIIHTGTHAITVNPDNHTVTALNESDLRKAWEVGVGHTPRTLAAAPNGTIQTPPQHPLRPCIIKLIPSPRAWPPLQQCSLFSSNFLDNTGGP
ncbi:MAG: Ig-like domain-containing protein, partial [Candidatus Tectimicrobiota bacterium]